MHIVCVGVYKGDIRGVREKWADPGNSKVFIVVIIKNSKQNCNYTVAYIVAQASSCNLQSNPQSPCKFFSSESPKSSEKSRI